MATVSAHEYLKAQGATFVVFHPGARLLYVGYGCDETPRVVPQCMAFYEQGASHGSLGAAAGAQQPWQPDQEAYSALVEAQKFLHLPVPPVPACLSQQQQQQQQHRPSDPQSLSQQQSQPQSQQQQPNSPTSPAGTQPAAGVDLFPAAKAGVVSSSSVPEGSDGFAWSRTLKAAAVAAAAAASGAQGSSQQQQQQSGQDAVQQQAAGGDTKAKHIPFFLGTQVAALPPGAPYRSVWLMTADGHIAELDVLPERVIADRFEAVWGWALAAELGLGPAQRSQLAAVLLVPYDMTAVEVRLLADVLLGRLGFASLVVHLEPVAATFGNGATCACVVNIGCESSSVACVDDAVVLQPISSRLKLSLGLTGITAALTGWMSAYRQWPPALQAAGMGWGGLLDARAGVYTSLVLEELAMQQCYYPKAGINPGLVGRAMLEDNPPAAVPLRLPGSPTVNFEISLGSWAAVAPMCLFYPQLAPSEKHVQQQQQQGQQWQSSAGGAAARPADGDAAGQDGDLLMTDAAGAAGEAPGMLLDPQPPASHAAAAAPTTPARRSSAGGRAAAEAAAAAAAAQAAAAAATAERAAELRHYRPMVHDVPAAEAMFVQSQLKARLEAGLPPVPPCGLYLPPMDAGAAGAGEGDEDAQEAAAAAAAGLQDAGAADAEAGSSSDLALDEAVFNSLMAVASRQPDVLERLSAGILLVGPGASIRGLGSMLERRVMQRFATIKKQQVVSVLEPRAHPAHIVWFGGVLLAALDAGRENWLPRQQWLQGGHPLPAAQQLPPPPPGLTSLANSAAARHSKLFFYCRAESGF